MSRLRVLHQLNAPTDVDSLRKHVVGLRSTRGCLEAELYGGVLNAGSMAIVELWEDQHAYSDHWASELAEVEPGPLRRAASGLDGAEATTEFYRHQAFHLDRVWRADNHRDRTPRIAWPASGGVRIVIQSSLANVEESLPGLLDNERETLREPGCQQFTWFRSIEFPEHLLLLELWEDQAIYDAHWHLRIKTGPHASNRQPSERRQGSNALEFYRHSAFRHLYDRWVPAHVAAWSETVIWPD